MYLNYDIYYHSPYINGPYCYEIPSQTYYGNQPISDERLFSPFFPSPGGPIGTTPPPRPPIGPPSSPPSFGPPSQGTETGPPTSPPPAYVPTQTQQAAAFAVDPGSIRRCLFRYTYVWLSNRQQFWYYPTFVGRNSVSGYRWN
ncbi:hypothetical protein [Bacillus sp. Marseille-P3661]|uniref:hypothetical protein n=1 Tax=Bacillus sp. Marseille-P3661 TaxID=1936234 RepID=UPI000C8613C5|nr:hypothetical protein [Bacillus sp. Marseille-P3661]